MEKLNNNSRRNGPFARVCRDYLYINADAKNWLWNRGIKPTACDIFHDIENHTIFIALNQGGEYALTLDRSGYKVCIRQLKEVGIMERIRYPLDIDEVSLSFKYARKP